jgi:hypothetical protein
MVSQIAVPRSRVLPEPLPMLLDLQDLPDGWSILDQRRWRTGITQAPWALRTKQVGGVTAWRSFQSATDGKWLWVQASPLANDSDINDALPDIWTRALRNLRANVRLVDEREGPSMEGIASATRTIEQTTEGPLGTGISRYVAWGYRGVLNALSASATRDTGSWSDVESLASKQNHRIDLTLNATKPV